MRAGCSLLAASIHSSSSMIPLLFLLGLPAVQACFMWGGCGFTGCGMGCGAFCRRALSAKTLKAYSESTGDPDADFRACCEARGLPAECLDKCSYKTFTKSVMVSMFLRVDSCPIEAATDMQRCASRGADHTECCKKNTVHTTLAGDKCLMFCKADSHNATLLDLSYLPCLDRFDSVNSCFWHDAVRENNEREEEETEDEGVEGKTREEEREASDRRETMRRRNSKWEMAKKRMQAMDDEDYEEFDSR